MKNITNLFVKKALAGLVTLIAIVSTFSCQNNSIDEVVKSNDNAKETALSQSTKIDKVKSIYKY